MARELICICGPTGVGKTDLALALALAADGEIVNADSRQLYRGMDIGTAKPTPEERARVPHHLIDVLDPAEPCSAGRFARMADAAIAAIRARGRRPIVVGGTGLYLRALVDGIWEGPRADPALRAALAAVADRNGRGEPHRMLARLDPASAAAIHPNDVHKTIRALEITLLCGEPASSLRARHGFPGRHGAAWFGLTRPRAELYDRIDRRVEAMIAAGWVDEVRRLLAAGIPLDAPGMNALGYAEIARHVHGEWPLAAAIQAVQMASRRYAKRQFTWFRKDARLLWLDVSGASPPDLVASVLNGAKQGESRVDVTISEAP
ncbi:MAG: tRNA (adenosine(37)-N6)-dimethylallyltransferase MiaA [Nitrospirae bacterium]|nr:tRNA (adenosine(37)-N6)-dimethylallyltransferase MiaA [Nitrospirota bacterium]